MITGRPVAAGSTPSNPKSRCSSYPTNKTARTGSLSLTQSSRHSQQSHLLAIRPLTKPFIIPPRFAGTHSIDGLHKVVSNERCRQLRRPYRMNTRISSAIETSVYVLVTVMTPRYSSRSIFFPPSLRQTPSRGTGAGAALTENGTQYAGPVYSEVNTPLNHRRKRNLRNPPNRPRDDPWRWLPADNCTSSDRAGNAASHRRGRANSNRSAS